MADHFLKRISVIHRLEHELVIADASLMFIEFPPMKIVAILTCKPELILTVKDEVLLIVQLVLQFLDLNTHPRAPLRLSVLSLSLCRHLMVGLLPMIHLMFH